MLLTLPSKLGWLFIKQELFRAARRVCLFTARFSSMRDDRESRVRDKDYVLDGSGSSRCFRDSARNRFFSSELEMMSSDVRRWPQVGKNQPLSSLHPMLMKYFSLPHPKLFQTVSVGQQLYAISKWVKMRKKHRLLHRILACKASE